MLVWSDNQIAKGTEGYGYVPDSIWPYLEQSGLPIRRSKPTTWGDVGTLQIPPDVARIKNLGIGYMEKDECINEIVINHSVPPYFIKSNIYSVGFTYWETNKLPNQWVKSLNNMDEVWTCSKAMTDVFIDSGVNKPIYTFELGIDPNIFYPKYRKAHCPFTFISIGSPSSRKNSQMAVNAFLKLFEGNYDYRLIYKSHGEPDARIIKNGVINPLVHPQIKLIDDVVSHEKLGDIYDMADCLIYPTSGEGWGMIPFQAIAKGIPTICTNALGSTEYANMSVPLNYKFENWNMNGVYEDAGEWAKPDFDDLCDKMRHVANHYELVAEKTYESALFIKENYSWENVSKKYINRMKEILKCQ